MSSLINGVELLLELILLQRVLSPERPILVLTQKDPIFHGRLIEPNSSACLPRTHTFTGCSISIITNSSTFYTPQCNASRFPSNVQVYLNKVYLVISCHTLRRIPEALSNSNPDVAGPAETHTAYAAPFHTNKSGHLGLQTRWFIATLCTAITVTYEFCNCCSTYRQNSNYGKP